MFKACHDSNTSRLKKLLQHASEPNETNLGMKSTSEYGKGATAEELSSLFLDFYKSVRNNPYIESNPLALCMYIRNFDKDKMSDLITNIIRKLLYSFTVKQCTIWGIPLDKKVTFIGYYWDYQNLRWDKLYGYPLMVGHKNILLVPKNIVRTRYVFNVECFIKQYILKDLQKEHLAKNTDLCVPKEYSNGRRVIFPPTIDDLYKLEVNGNVHKDYAFSFSCKNKLGEDEYVKAMLKRIGDGYGSVSDEQLDSIVYNKFFKSA